MISTLAFAALWAGLAVQSLGPEPPTTKAFLMGQFSPKKHPDFIEVDAAYTQKSSIYLHKDTYQAFQRMAEAAAKDGLTLTILSATRNFDAQKRIWENKWTGQRKVEGHPLPETHPDPRMRALKILEYSSMPGTSRHHWGTDFDINALENEYFLSGNGLKLDQWLTQHAASFGFCRPYSARSTGRSEGYEEEKWHLSYVPLSARFTQAFTQEVGYPLQGFMGAEVAEDIQVIEKWVLGICTTCLPDSLR
jgi:D-alanyl-D-alanine carboxypeptidase